MERDHNVLITLCLESFLTICSLSPTETNRKCDLAGRVSPQPSILGSSSSWDDFSDEDAGVVAHVGVVSSSRYAEAKARVSLQENERRESDGDESEARSVACSPARGE